MKFGAEWLRRGLGCVCRLARELPSRWGWRQLRNQLHGAEEAMGKPNDKGKRSPVIEQALNQVEKLREQLQRAARGNQPGQGQQGQPVSKDNAASRAGPGRSARPAGPRPASQGQGQQGQGQQPGRANNQGQGQQAGSTGPGQRGQQGQGGQQGGQQQGEGQAGASKQVVISTAAGSISSGAATGWPNRRTRRSYGDRFGVGETGRLSLRRQHS